MTFYFVNGAQLSQLRSLRQVAVKESQSAKRRETRDRNVGRAAALGRAIKIITQEARK